MGVRQLNPRSPASGVARRATIAMATYSTACGRTCQPNRWRSPASEAGKCRSKPYGMTRSPAHRRTIAAAFGATSAFRGSWPFMRSACRCRIIPNPRRPADNNASVHGSGTPSGPLSVSDRAFTAKVTSPTLGNVTEKPRGVRSCKVPSLRIFGRVRPWGVGIALSGLVSGSDWNVARIPTVAPFDTKLSSSRTSLTPPPPPSIVVVPSWLSPFLRVMCSGP